MLSYDFRATANYNTNFGEDHIINLFAGTEANSIDRNKTYFNGWGMQYSMGEIPFYVYQFFKKSIEDGADYYSLANTASRSTAFFGNATYSYKGKYTVNGTIRYEGTNRLGKAGLPVGYLPGIYPVPIMYTKRSFGNHCATPSPTFPSKLPIR